MIPYRLTLKNFISHKDTDIDFSDLDAICLYGDNGAGKTTIIDGILYALYSNCSRGRDDSLIMMGEKKLTVDFYFFMNGKIYRIVKEKERGKTKNAYLYDGSTLLATGEKVDEYIEKLLGINYETFTSTFFLLQDNAYKFILATPSERYKVLFDILGLNVYQSYKKVASALRKEIEGKLIILKQQLQKEKEIAKERKRYEDELQEIEKELDEIMKEKAEIEAENLSIEKGIARLTEALKATEGIDMESIQKKIESLTMKVARFREILKKETQVQEAIKRRDEINRTQEDLFKEESEHMKAYEETKERYNRIVERETEIRRRIDTLNGKIKDIEKEIGQIEKNINEYRKIAGLLDEVPCGGTGKFSSCELIKNAVVSKEKIPELESLTGIKKTEIHELETEREKENSLLQEVAREKEAIIEKGKGVKARLADIASMKTSLLQEIRTVEETARLQGEIATAKAEISVTEKEIEKLTEEKNKLRDIEQRKRAIIEELNKKEIEKQQIAERMENIKRQERESLQKRSDIESQITLCKNSERNIETIDVQLREAEDSHTTYTILEDAYEKIPKIIFLNYIASLQEKTNEVLSAISTTGMQVSLVTEKQTKTTKQVKNTLDIIVSDIAGERKIENFSGGEKTRLTLAFTVALSELASKKSGQKIMTLAIDEPPGLDMQGYRDFARTVNDLIKENMFAKCFVISHSGDMIEEFPQRIEVKKTVSKGSVVSIRR